MPKILYIIFNFKSMLFGAFYFVLSGVTGKATGESKKSLIG